jgi:hypothetical protein
VFFRVVVGEKVLWLLKNERDRWTLMFPEDY